MTRAAVQEPSGDAAVEATISLADATATRWQTVVVGAGPAGFATALRLAARGLRVLLLEAGSMPRPKLCGCCLSVTGLRELARLQDLAGEAAALTARMTLLRRVRLATPGTTAAVPFAGGGVISREALDTAGVRAAIDAGCHWLPQTRVTLVGEPTPPGGRESCPDAVTVSVCGDAGETRGQLTADLVVLATGLATGIRFNNAGDPLGGPQITAESRLGVGTTLPPEVGGPPVGELVMAVSRGGYCGVVRLEDGRVDLAAAVERRYLAAAGSPAAAITGILEATDGDRLTGLSSPASRRLLAAATYRGTPPLSRTSSLTSPSGRILRVGDTAGYVEPFTGEGMGWALTSARLLDEAVAAAGGGRPGVGVGHPAAVAAGYAVGHRRHFSIHHARCRRVALAVRRPWLVGSAVRLARFAPALAARVVPFVVGTTPPSEAHG
jgi:flavin-dependent dehydrogenase